MALSFILLLAFVQFHECSSRALIVPVQGSSLVDKEVAEEVTSVEHSGAAPAIHVRLLRSFGFMHASSANEEDPVPSTHPSTSP